MCGPGAALELRQRLPVGLADHERDRRRLARLDRRRPARSRRSGTSAPRRSSGSSARTSRRRSRRAASATRPSGSERCGSRAPPFGKRKRRMRRHVAAELDHDLRARRQRDLGSAARVALARDVRRAPAGPSGTRAAGARRAGGPRSRKRSPSLSFAPRATSTTPVGVQRPHRVDAAAARDADPAAATITTFRWRTARRGRGTSCRPGRSVRVPTGAPSRAIAAGR